MSEEFKFWPTDFQHVEGFKAMSGFNLYAAIAHIANRKLAEYLAKQTVVYAIISDDTGFPLFGWDTPRHRNEKNTHRAILVNIEPIYKLDGPFYPVNLSTELKELAEENAKLKAVNDGLMATIKVIEDGCVWGKK